MTTKDDFRLRQKELIKAIQRLGRTVDFKTLLEWMEEEFDPDQLTEETNEKTWFKLGQRDVFRQIKRTINYKSDE